MSKSMKRLIRMLTIGFAPFTLGFAYDQYHSPPSTVIHVTNPKDLRKVSAMFMMDTGTGTATVIRSGPKGSDLLTNHHVCEEATKSGAAVLLNYRVYRVRAIKPSAEVDLCLAHVDEDLHTSVEVADHAAEIGDEILSGGYPLHMPLLIQKGYSSRVFNAGPPMKPMWTLLTSFVVQGGHSGTGVFDHDGKLVGVIMAFKPSDPEDTMGFGLAVPWKETKRFLEVESNKLQWTLVPYEPSKP